MDGSEFKVKPLIEFCASNMSHGTGRVMQALKADSEHYDVQEYGCLGNCGECYEFPYAIVEGETVLANSVEELALNIPKELERQLQKRAEIDKLLDQL